MRPDPMSKLVLIGLCTGLLACAERQAQYYIDQLSDPRAALGIGGADIRRVRLRTPALLHARTAVCNRIGSVVARVVGGGGSAAGVVERRSVGAGSNQQPAQHSTRHARHQAGN